MQVCSFRLVATSPGAKFDGGIDRIVAALQARGFGPPPISDAEGTELYASIAAAAPKPINGNLKDPATGIRLIEKEQGPWIGLPRKSSTSSLLIERQWQRDFWERYKYFLNDESQLVAIIGTPGLGKTVALNWLLWKFLTVANDAAESAMVFGPNRRYVMLVLPSQSTYLFDTRLRNATVWGGSISPQHAVDAAPAAFREELIILHDLRSQRPVTDPYFPTVLATSPKEDNYKQFLKDAERIQLARASRFYAPVFSDDEMEFTARHVFPARVSDWRKSAHYFGNVPRPVLTRGTEELDTYFDAVKGNACTACNDPAFVDQVFLPGGQVEQKLSDTVVKIVPFGNYKRYRLEFRGPGVLEAVTDAAVQRILNHARMEAQTTADGKAFENLLLMLLTGRGFLPSHGITTLYDAQSGPCSKAPPVKDILSVSDARRSIQLFGKDQKIDLANKTIYRPLLTNYPLLDAFMFVPGDSAAGTVATLLCFQVTFANSHAPTASTLSGFVQKFNSDTEFLCGRKTNDPARPGERAKIVVPAAPTAATPVQLQLGTSPPQPLAIVFAYFTRSSDFGRQNISTAGSALSGKEQQKWTTVWNSVAQYCVDVGAPAPKKGV